MKYALFFLVFSFSTLTSISNIFASEREEAVIVGCQATSVDGYSYAACVAAGLTENEINTCIRTPKKCFGEGNEIRNLLCSAGIGCPKKAYKNPLQWVMPYRGGCIAVFKSGTYFSPDCKDLAGGGRTKNVWDVREPHAKYIKGMVVFKGCVITAFSGGGIYRSCDGYNLGGGGKTAKVYQGAKVNKMTIVSGSLHTTFGASCYSDPIGVNPGGGGRTSRC